MHASINAQLDFLKSLANYLQICLELLAKIGQRKCVLFSYHWGTTDHSNSCPDLNIWSSYITEQLFFSLFSFTQWWEEFYQPWWLLLDSLIYRLTFWPTSQKWILFPGVTTQFSFSSLIPWPVLWFQQSSSCLSGGLLVNHIVLGSEKPQEHLHRAHSKSRMISSARPPVYSLKLTPITFHSTGSRTICPTLYLAIKSLTFV
jgi:hypothetical protein